MTSVGDVTSVCWCCMGEVVLRLILLRKCKLNALVIPSPRFWMVCIYMHQIIVRRNERWKKEQHHSTMAMATTKAYRKAASYIILSKTPPTTYSEMGRHAAHHLPHRSAPSVLAFSMQYFGCGSWWIVIRRRLSAPWMGRSCNKNSSINDQLSLRQQPVPPVTMDELT